MPHARPILLVGNHRGYVRVTASAAQIKAGFVKVSSVVQKDLTKVTLLVRKSFVVLDGQPVLHDA